MASAALYFGARVLDQFQNVGQIGEIVQGQLHQREQIGWARRAYNLDCQSVRLDVWNHVKDEIRSHYDTYMGRIDTLLLVLALIWPFALATIQFSDPFMPRAEQDCDDCVEVRYYGLVIVWTILVGLILVLPFWGILMCIRCKLKLDRWLEYSLARLNHARRAMHSSTDAPSEGQERNDDTKEVVNNFLNVCAQCQEYLALIWMEECGWLVHGATILLWLSACGAMLLTATSMFMYLMNKGGHHSQCAVVLMIIVAVGLTVPAAYVIRQRSWDLLEPPSGHGEELTLALALSNRECLHLPEERRRKAASFRHSFASKPFIDNSPTFEASPRSRADSNGSQDPTDSPCTNNNGHFGVSKLGWCARRNGSGHKTMAAPLLGARGNL
eukprot:TRINITY_DN15083_c0_g1_i2.p1 TRINITY_DN15083_c0_g1~~TRINITY_DN15083_c0_g1_i2.p1  ORF type:complete len:384 (+),score=58.36 TRINITY_DN15083_c0_g1_i2:36-1187(+)